MEEELKAYKELIGGMCSGIFVANDFFAYASGWTVEINIGNFGWMKEHVKKYPKDGMDSVIAYIQNIEPIQPHLTDGFKVAIQDLVDRKQEVYGDDEGYGYSSNGPYRTLKED